MRYDSIYNTSRALPRMSWAGINLYNLYARSLGNASGVDETTFKRTFMTLFQQRWKAKRLVRGYHGDGIGEKMFKKWYLPELIPDVRPRRPLGLGVRSLESLRMANRTKEAASLERAAKRSDEDMAQAPVGSLMFIEVEKRIDTVIFRACLATSVYQARHLVLTGKVKINGVICRSPGIRLEPGDMVSVDPEAISFLRKPAATSDPEITQELSEGGEATPEASESVEETQVAANGLENSSDIASSGSEPEQESKYRQRTAQQNRSSSSHGLSRGYHLDLPDYAAPFIFVPAFLEVSFVTCSVIYVRDPTARKNYSELPTPYDADGELMRLAWEWYVRVRPRTRGKLQKATGPHGTRRPVPYWSEYSR